MRNDAGSFTDEREAELRKNIDLSDIPEIKNFSDGRLRNCRDSISARTSEPEEETEYHENNDTE